MFFCVLTASPAACTSVPTASSRLDSLAAWYTAKARENVLSASSVKGATLEPASSAIMATAAHAVL